MADEIQHRYGLRIVKRAADGSLLIDKNYNGAFSADMAGKKGPVGGAIAVPTTGVAVDLSALTTPGWVVFRHTGRVTGEAVAGDYVDIGIRDTDMDRFHPFAEIRADPGKQSSQEFAIPLSRNLGEQHTATGTAAPDNTLWLKAYVAAQTVVVEVYEA